MTGAFSARLLVAAVWVGAATAAQVLRQPGVPAYDTIWAEDGHVFLTDALQRGPVDVLFRPLAGYAHLLPRLLGEVAAALPLRAAAQVFSTGSALIVALLSLYVFHASRTVVSAVWARAALCGLYVLLPATAYESSNTAANLHFYLPLPVFLALLQRPDCFRAALPGVIVVVAATLSDPRVGFLLPFALYGLWKGKNLAAPAISGAFVLGLAAQLAVVVWSRSLTPEPGVSRYPVTFATHVGQSDLFDLPRLFGLRVVGPLVVGERWLDDLFRSFGWLTALVAIVLVALVAVIGARRISRPDRLWMAGALGMSVIFFVTHALAWGTKEFWPYQPFFLVASRYVQTPMLFLLLFVLIAFGGRSATVADRRRPWRYGYLLLLGALVIFNFSPRIPRSDGPSWSRELSTAQEGCRSSAATTVTIAISPRSLSDPWYVTAPCRKLRRAAGG